MNNGIFYKSKLIFLITVNFVFLEYVSSKRYFKRSKLFVLRQFNMEVNWLKEWSVFKFLVAES